MTAEDDGPGPRGAGLAAVAEGDPLAPHLAFSTLDLPPREQFAAWRGAVARMLDVARGTGAEADPFSAERRVWILGAFALSVVRAPAARLARSAAQVRADSLDHWMIGVARCGERRLRLGELSVAVPAGTASILSLDEPLVEEHQAGERVCLIVPRDAFPEIGPALDASRRRPLDGAMERVLAGYLLQLAGDLPATRREEAPRLAEATRAMVAACVLPSPDALAAAGAHVERVQLARVKTIIRQQLRSALLRPERLCQAAGISRSQLYRLFEPLGGVARYIQAERLRAACRALASPTDGRDISAIAEDVGFFDHSTFSRIFRRDIGCSPRAWRAAALAGHALLPSGAMAQGSAQDLVQLLRRL